MAAICLKSTMLNDDSEVTSSRTVIRFAGPDSIKFLQGMLTNDVHRFGELFDEKVTNLATSNLPTVGTSPVYAALLTAQGWFLYDFFLYRPPRSDEKLDRTGSGPGPGSDQVEVLADVDGSVVDEVVDSLKRYRLRSKVDIEHVGKDFCCWQRYGGDLSDKSSVEEPESAGVGWGGNVDGSAMSSSQAPLVEADKETSEENYLLWRLEQGVAEGPNEIPKGEAIPLEYNLAGLNAISFDKGCYLEQELVERTHHRGVIRKRLLPLKFVNDNGKEVEQKVAPGSTVVDPSSGKKIGTVTTALGSRGLGLLRLEEAIKKSGGLAIQGYEDVKVESIIPKWWPAECLVECFCARVVHVRIFPPFENCARHTTVHLDSNIGDTFSFPLPAASKTLRLEEPESAGVGWGGNVGSSAMSSSQGSEGGWQWFKNPRLDCLGFRGIFPSGTPPPLVEADKETSEENYLLWRLEQGIAESPNEIPKGEAVSLEYNLAGLNAISFDKGCYVGQELVARTHHRGVIRKRLLLYKSFAEVGQKVAPGSTVGGPSSSKKIGTVTTALGSREVDGSEFALKIKMKYPSVKGYKLLSLDNARGLRALWASVYHSNAASMDLFIDLTPIQPSNFIPNPSSVESNLTFTNMLSQVMRGEDPMFCVSLSANSVDQHQYDVNLNEGEFEENEDDILINEVEDDDGGEDLVTPSAPSGEFTRLHAINEQFVNRWIDGVYVEFVKGGEFCVGQRFNNKLILSQFVRQYHIERNQVFRTAKSKSTTVTYKCGRKPTPCMWTLRASQKDVTKDVFTIVTYKGPHLPSCVVDAPPIDHPNLNKSFIVKHKRTLVEADWGAKISLLRASMTTQFNFTPSDFTSFGM
ncbi:hypothetical protein KSS87_022093 [Heliosperma pusillum]|nr:hypothetical protein KSS87_022093 [Heliosperma pusillum]